LKLFEGAWIGSFEQIRTPWTIPAPWLISLKRGFINYGDVAIVRQEGALGKSKPAEVANSQEKILLWMGKTAGQLG
jgi:hypothetical protein